MLDAMRYVFALCLLAAACGSDDGTNDAPASCSSTVDAVSARNADCAAESGAIAAGQRDAFYTEFRAGMTTTLDCSRMTKILGSPQVCIEELRAMPCSTFDKQNGLLPMPASCKGLYGK